MAESTGSSPDAGAETRDAVDTLVKRGKDSAASLADAARDAVHSTADSAREAGAKASASVKEGIEKQSASTADTLLHLADKLAEGRDAIGEPWMASLVGQTEASLRSVSTYLAASKPDRYMSDLSEFARKNPAIALGGAVAIGFLLARAGKTAVHGLADADATMPSASATQASSAGWASTPANSIPAE